MLNKFSIGILVLFLSSLQFFADLPSINFNTAYAEVKASAPKKPTAEKKIVEKPQMEKQKPDEIEFFNGEFPDGLIDKHYNFGSLLKNAVPPYKATVISGTIPPGLKIDPAAANVGTFLMGTPTKTGEWPLSLRVTDAKGKQGTITGIIRIWRLVTVGEHGKFKGENGLQMALNAAQDMDEIGIEAGTYGVTGLRIPENKAWEHGIKISGEWNEMFAYRERSYAGSHSEGDGGFENDTTTVLDGGGMESRILTIANSKGTVYITGITFKNSKNAAVEIKSSVTFESCVFKSNSVRSAMSGGAVYGKGTFKKCSFIGNRAQGLYGGAVYGGGEFYQCYFQDNSANAAGGAVYGGGNFEGCNFIRNSARSGGAVHGEVILKNSSFVSNSAGTGGAVEGGGIFQKCRFLNNAAYTGGAVNGKGNYANCIFNGNRHGAVYGDGSFINSVFMNNLEGFAFKGNGRFINSTFYNNNAGAISGGGTVMNSIFFNNGGTDIAVDHNRTLDIDYSLIGNIKGAANYGANNIIGDPKFAAPETGELHLRPDSPCINAGKITAELNKDSLDLDGKVRIVNGKIDIGAYEWQDDERGDSVIGMKLFSGAKSFANGGPSCASCHMAGELGKGTRAPDLTKVYGSPAKPLLAAAWFNGAHAYTDKNITEDEVAHIRAFLRDVWTQK